MQAGQVTGEDPTSMPDGEEATDADLVARARAGSSEAFALLFDRHAPRLYALARHLLADPEEALDVLQSAFAQALDALPHLQRPEAFGGWMTRIDGPRRTRRAQRTQAPAARRAERAHRRHLPGAGARRVTGGHRACRRGAAPPRPGAQSTEPARSGDAGAARGRGVAECGDRRGAGPEGRTVSSTWCSFVPAPGSAPST